VLAGLRTNIVQSAFTFMRAQCFTLALSLPSLFGTISCRGQNTDSGAFWFKRTRRVPKDTQILALSSQFSQTNIVLKLQFKSIFII